MLAPEEIAPAVRTAARGAAGHGCVDYDVAEERPGDPAQTKALVRGEAAQVWISDHPVRVATINAQRRQGDPTAAALTRRHAFAFSPVVLARPSSAGPVASSALRSWSAALTALPVQAAGMSSSTPTAAVVSDVLREVTLPPPTEIGTRLLDLADSKRRTAALYADAGTSRGRPFPTTEQQLVAYNRGHRDRELGAFTPGAGRARLEYAAVALDSGDTTTSAISELEAQLTGDTGRKALHDAGFRVTQNDGGFGVDGIPDRLSRAAEADGLTQGQQDLLTKLNAAARPMRMLAVIDVSGSMARRVPGVGTRLDAAMAASHAALRLMDPDSQVGLWAFSTRLGPDGADYVKVFDVKTLGDPLTPTSHLATVNRSLDRVRSLIGGGTALYDTIWAAYRDAQAHYDPAFENSVVVLTDGRNDDPGGGLSKQELLDRLSAADRASRPVRLILIGFTVDADAAELADIARAAGGRSYLARQAQQIGSILVDAVYSRTG